MMAPRMTEMYVHNYFDDNVYVIAWLLGHKMLVLVYFPVKACDKDPFWDMQQDYVPLHTQSKVGVMQCC